MVVVHTTCKQVLLRPVSDIVWFTNFLSPIDWIGGVLFPIGSIGPSIVHDAAETEPVGGAQFSRSAVRTVRRWWGPEQGRLFRCGTWSCRLTSVRADRKHVTNCGESSTGCGAVTMRLLKIRPSVSTLITNGLVQRFHHPKRKQAFDISREPEKVRDMYGRTSLGQRLLLCRRLIEAGVPFVTCNSAGWDHHGQIFPILKGTLVPGVGNAGGATAFELDQALSALLIDLDERGLLETTLVLALGEFGRVPTITGGGRNHWPHAMSVLMAGAGVPRGHVVGATDKHAAHADQDVYSPEDFRCYALCQDGYRSPQRVTHARRPASAHCWRCQSCPCH